MKRRILFLTLTAALLCAGCGAQSAPPSAPPQAETMEPLGVEVTDGVLSTWETTVADGRALRVEAVGRLLRPEYGQYGVRELRVYDGDALLQTLSVQEAIDADGVSGVVEGYTDCHLPDGGLTLLDMNFDGMDDLGLFAWIPAGGNLPYYYWLWDEDAGQFQYAFCLCNAVPDAKTRQIVSETHSGADYYTEFYVYDSNGALELVRQVVETYGVTQDAPVTKVYERIDGELVLVE